MAIFILPAGLLVCVLLVAPMLMMARISLNHYDAATLMIEAVTGENYLRAVADPYYQRVLLMTLAVAVFCTVVTVILAFPAAYWLSRMDSKLKSLVTILTMFPLLVGNVVRSAGWIALLGNDGLINASLQGAGLTTAPLKLLYTPGAVVIGIIGIVLPYMVLTLSAVIEGIPRHTEEVAANLGARPFTVFRRVVLPLAMPGVVAGSVLVFILSMNAYATPVLLGGPQFQMMAPAVYDQFNRVSNWPFGAALAFILLAVTLLMTVIGSLALSRKYKLA